MKYIYDRPKPFTISLAEKIIWRTQKILGRDTTYIAILILGHPHAQFLQGPSDQFPSSIFKATMDVSDRVRVLVHLAVTVQNNALVVQIS
jgi:hypothetical protein